MPWRRCPVHYRSRLKSADRPKRDQGIRDPMGNKITCQQLPRLQCFTNLTNPVYAACRASAQ